jgi:hypothetical protein
VKSRASYPPELVREALRTYFSNRFAEAPVSAAELRAIRRGRAQIRWDEYVTLDELFDALESKNRQASKKRVGLKKYMMI